jgi:hypothetical protein
MNFRARLSLFALEPRENPSGPAPIDPTGDPTPPQDPTDPGLTQPPPAPDDGTGGNTSDPLLGNNDIFGNPIVP